MPSSEGELWVQAARQDMAIRTSATAPPPPAVLGAEAAAEIPVPTAAANNVADQSPSRDTEPSDKTVSFAGAASETIAKSPNKLIRRQSSIDREALSKARQKLVLYTASMNAIVSTAANTVYLPGLAMVEEEFDTSTAMVALTVTFYTIGACVQPLIAGPVADAIGRRRPMLVAHGVFILASVGCAVAPTIHVLIALRLLQALGGCTFLIIGQAQVGDVFSRDDLSEAMALFALSRTFAVMVGPLGGGLLCELIGWRSTFWACAIIDALLFVISFVYIPETITTLPEDRKKLTFCLPFRPLVELKYRSVGMLCLVNGAVWGMLYLFFITYPMVFSMMTDNEFMIGVYMLPGICGTLVGAKIAGKLGRPKTAPEKLTEKKKCCDWKSFWRTWFPWSVCGRCCSCLAAENINSKTDVRFLGFPVPALGEWCSVVIGVLMAIGGSSVVGWALTLACDDGMLLPSLSDATGAIDAANTAVSANSSAGVMTRLPPAIYDPFDIDQMVYRLDNKLYCKEFNWWAIIIYWCLMFVLCAGAMMIVVGTSTYLSQARPASRSSVAASQRSAQMLAAAITMSVGGVLFDVIGPGWTHSIVTMAGAPLAIFGLCCVPRNPEGTRAFKEAEQEAKEKEKAAAKKVDGGRP